MAESIIINKPVIIEEGQVTVTNITWRYQKWSDGTARCWGYYESGSLAPNASVGGFYERIIDGFSFPNNLFSYTPNAFANLSYWGTGYFWAQVRNASASGFQLAMWRNDNASSLGYAEIYAVGRWR